MTDYQFDKIHIEKNFLDRSICQEIVSYFNARNNDIGIDYHGWGNPNVIVADVVKPYEMLEQILKIPGSGLSSLLNEYFTEDLISSLKKTSKEGHFYDKSVSNTFLALNDLKDDRYLFPNLVKLINIPKEERVWYHFERLVKQGIYLKKEENYTCKSELTESDLYNLQWFNHYLIQNYLFPDTYFKSNAIFPDLIEINPVIQLLKETKLSRSLYHFLEEQKQTELCKLIDEKSVFSLTQFFRLFFSDRKLVNQYMEKYTNKISFNLKYIFNKLFEKEKIKSKFDFFWDDYFGNQVNFQPIAEAGEIKNRTYDVFDYGLLDWKNADEKIQKAIRNAMNKLTYERAEAVYDMTCRFVERVILYRYSAGAFFNAHNDRERYLEVDGEEQWVQTHDRDLALLLYLSDESDYIGGELAFPDKDICIKPEQGTAVIFPCDHRYMHEVKLIEAGSRYVLTSFIATDKTAEFV